MRIQPGDKVVVINPTKDLPAFKISGEIYTVQNVHGVDDGRQYLDLKEKPRFPWEATRFEKYETNPKEKK